MNSSNILKRLQEIGKKHKTEQPRLSLDSLALAFQMTQEQLQAPLNELEAAGLIYRERNSITLTTAGVEALA